MRLGLVSCRMAAAFVAEATPPTLSAPAVPAAGTTLTATLSEYGCTADGGNPSGTGGFALTGLSGGAVTAGAWAISGVTLTVTLTGRAVAAGETGGKLAYARASTTDDLKDSVGNYLANFSNVSVTNNSTRPAPP